MGFVNFIKRTGQGGSFQIARTFSTPSVIWHME